MGKKVKEKKKKKKKNKGSSTHERVDVVAFHQMRSKVASVTIQFLTLARRVPTSRGTAATCSVI